MKYNVVESGLTFGAAFDKMRADKLNILGMRLPQWSEDVVIRIQYPNSVLYDMTAPYLYVQSRYGRVPWKETMIELFSKKWQLVNIVDDSIDYDTEKNKKEYPNEECSCKCLHRCIGECGSK